MKGINFIQPLPTQREREIRAWCWLTVVSSSSALIAIIIYTSMQWTLYRSLVREKLSLEHALSSFSSVMAKQHKQGAKQKQLQQKINRLTKYTTSPKSPAAPLSCFQTVGPALQAVTISKQQFTMHIHCTNAQQANLYVQNLMQNKAIRTAQLLSLHADKKHIIAQIKGRIT